MTVVNEIAEAIARNPKIKRVIVSAKAQAGFGCRPCRRIYDPKMDWASWSWIGHRSATQDQLPPVPNGER